MSYSKDFRQQVLSHIDAGSTIDAMSKLFSVGTTTIKRWKNLRKMTGDLLGPGRPKKAYKISGIFVALKRVRITRKKSPLSTKSDVK